MRICQIADMNVVPDCRSIGSIVIIPVDGELIQVSLNDHQRPRNQMSFGVPKFADEPAIICPASIEIAQPNRVEPI